MKTPIIVGIDPGTTTGISILNLGGELILMWSGKNAGKAEISNIISETGTPVVISCDTNPPPRMVEKIAATFSSRLEAPKEDFLRKDKYMMTREFIDCDGVKVFKNRHERDALASALYGWSRIKNLVSRIDRKLDELGRKEEGIGSFVKINVILNQESIDKSVKRFLD